MATMNSGMMDPPVHERDDGYHLITCARLMPCDAFLLTVTDQGRSWRRDGPPGGQHLQEGSCDHTSCALSLVRKGVTPALSGVHDGRNRQGNAPIIATFDLY